MTKREAEAIVAYAGDLCIALRMPCWTVLVMEDPADEEDEASVKAIDQRHVAQIYLNAGWMKYDYDRRRDTITHEVLHLLHARVSTVVVDDSKAYMRDQDHEDWVRRVRREFELMVDHLAGWMSRTHSLEEAWDIAQGRRSS